MSRRRSDRHGNDITSGGDHHVSFKGILIKKQNALK